MGHHSKALRQAGRQVLVFMKQWILVIATVKGEQHNFAVCTTLA